MREHPGLARAGAGDDEQRTAAVDDGVELVGVEPVGRRVDVGEGRRASGPRAVHPACRRHPTEGVRARPGAAAVARPAISARRRPGSGRGPAPRGVVEPMISSTRPDRPRVPMTTRSASRDASIRAKAPVPAATTGTISAPFGATPVAVGGRVDGAAQPGVVVGDLLPRTPARARRPDRRRPPARSRRATRRPARRPAGAAPSAGRPSSGRRARRRRSSRRRRRRRRRTGTRSSPRTTTTGSVGVVDDVVGRRAEQQRRLARPGVADDDDDVGPELLGGLDERPPGGTVGDPAVDAAAPVLGRSSVADERLGRSPRPRWGRPAAGLVAGHDREVPGVDGDDGIVRRAPRRAPTTGRRERGPTRRGRRGTWSSRPTLPAVRPCCPPRHRPPFTADPDDRRAPLAYVHARPSRSGSTHQSIRVTDASGPIHQPARRARRRRRPASPWPSPRRRQPRTRRSRCRSRRTGRTTGLITADDDWSGVPGVIGYRGDVHAGPRPATDPQTLLAAGIGDRRRHRQPSTRDTFGHRRRRRVRRIADPVVALQGSGTADAPNLVVTLVDDRASATSTLAYVVRDIDANADDAVQPARRCSTASARPATSRTSPAAFVADASTGPSRPRRSTPVALAAAGRRRSTSRSSRSASSRPTPWAATSGSASTTSRSTGTPGSGGRPRRSPRARPRSTVGRRATAASARRLGDRRRQCHRRRSPSRRRPSPASRSRRARPGAGDARRRRHDRRRHVPRHDHVHHRRRPDDVVHAAPSPSRSLPITPISTIQGAGAASLLVGDRVDRRGRRDVAVHAPGRRRRLLRPGGGRRRRRRRRDVRGHLRVLPRLVPDGSPPATSCGCAGTVAEFFEMTQVDVTGGGAVDGAVERQRRCRRRRRSTCRPPVSTKAAGDVRVRRGHGRHVHRRARPSTEHFELARFGQLRADRAATARTSSPTTTSRASTATPRHVADAGDAHDHPRRRQQRPERRRQRSGPDEPYPYPSRRPEHDEPTCAPATRSRASPACCTTRSPARPAPTPGASARSPACDYTFDAARPAPGRARGRRRPRQVAASTSSTTSRRSTRRRRRAAGRAGRSGTLDCRGADSAAELARQRAKEVVAPSAPSTPTSSASSSCRTTTARRSPTSSPALNARPGAGAVHASSATGVDRRRRHQGDVHLPAVGGDAGRRVRHPRLAPTTPGSSTPATARR